MKRLLLALTLIILGGPCYGASDGPVDVQYAFGWYWESCEATESVSLGRAPFVTDGSNLYMALANGTFFSPEARDHLYMINPETGLPTRETNPGSRYDLQLKKEGNTELSWDKIRELKWVTSAMNWTELGKSRLFSLGDSDIVWRPWREIEWRKGLLIMQLQQRGFMLEPEVAEPGACLDISRLSGERPGEVLTWSGVSGEPGEVIQSSWLSFGDFEAEARRIQGLWRGSVARKNLADAKAGATRIATEWCGSVACKNLADAKAGATRIATAWRGSVARKNLADAKAGATRIATAWRGHTDRRNIQRVKKFATLSKYRIADPAHLRARVIHRLEALRDKVFDGSSGSVKVATYKTNLETLMSAIPKDADVKPEDCQLLVEIMRRAGKQVRNSGLINEINAGDDDFFEKQICGFMTPGDVVASTGLVSDGGEVTTDDEEDDEEEYYDTRSNDVDGLVGSSSSEDKREGNGAVTEAGLTAPAHLPRLGGCDVVEPASSPAALPEGSVGSETPPGSAHSPVDSPGNDPVEASLGLEELMEASGNSTNETEGSLPIPDGSGLGVEAFFATQNREVPSVGVSGTPSEGVPVAAPAPPPSVPVVQPWGPSFGYSQPVTTVTSATADAGDDGDEESVDEPPYDEEPEEGTASLVFRYIDRSMARAAKKEFGQQYNGEAAPYFGGIDVHRNGVPQGMKTAAEVRVTTLQDAVDYTERYLAFLETHKRIRFRDDLVRHARRAVTALTELDARSDKEAALNEVHKLPLIEPSYKKKIEKA